MDWFKGTAIARRQGAMFSPMKSTMFTDRNTFGGESLRPLLPRAWARSGGQDIPRFPGGYGNYTYYGRYHIYYHYLI